MRAPSIPPIQIKASILIVFLLGVSIVGTASGGTFPSADDSLTEQTITPVVVTGTSDVSLSGKSQIDRNLLENIPLQNSSIIDAVTFLPGVQTSEETALSTRGGEFTPPYLSISGGKAYQNYFAIDGIGTNSFLNPMSDNPNNSSSLPNYPQTLFLNPRLVENITMFRYNVPAAYGEFTGGVVSANTIKQTDTFWGEINYKTTRDGWSEFFIDEEDREDFENSDSFVSQPHFEKHAAGALVHAPVTDNMSLLTGYQLLYSEIPLKYLGSTRTQTRKIENFLVRLEWQATPTTVFSSAVYYAPSENFYFTPNSVDGDITIRSDSYTGYFSVDHLTSTGTFKLNAAYSSLDTTRDANPEFRPWMANINGVPTSKPWGNLVRDTYLDQIVSYEGSVGPLETKQTSYQFNLDWLSTPLKTDKLENIINAGIKYERIEGSTFRSEPANQYLLSSAGKIDTDGDGINDTFVVKNDDYYQNLACPEGSIDCIVNEQLFLSRQHTPAGYANGTINLLNFYLEDNINFYRISVRPGINVAHDDFTKNLNTAPRLAVSYDIFGEGSTVVIGGLNRYYGRTLLAYKLREAYPSAYNESRTVDTSSAPPMANDNWTGTPKSGYRYSELKTPYSDETVLGIDQGIWDGRLKLTWLRREGRDEFAQEKTAVINGVSYYQLNNLGESHHDEYTIEWSKHFNRAYLAINATYQESYSSNENYDVTFDEGDATEKVLYKGEVVDLSQLPREDFNRPIAGNLIIATELPWGINFTNISKYRGRYIAREKITPTPADLPPDAVAAYEDVKHDDSWTTDWFISWTSRYLESPTLQFNFEIYNVFNEKTQVADTEEYKLGRQFWAGFNYKF